MSMDRTKNTDNFLKSNLKKLQEKYSDSRNQKQEQETDKLGPRLGKRDRIFGRTVEISDDQIGKLEKAFKTKDNDTKIISERKYDTRTFEESWRIAGALEKWLRQQPEGDFEKIKDTEVMENFKESKSSDSNVSGREVYQQMQKELNEKFWNVWKNRRLLEITCSVRSGTNLSDDDSALPKGKLENAIDDYHVALANIVGVAKALHDIRKGDHITIKGDSVQYKSARDNKFDEKAFSGEVNSVIKEAFNSNRMNVLESLFQVLNQTDMPLEQKKELFSGLDVLTKIDKNNKNMSEQHEGLPQPPEEGPLDISKKSLELFVRKESGHTFTGIVYIGSEREKPKIFLMPAQPSKGSDRDPEKIYPGEPHESDSEYIVFKKREITSHAIVHLEKNENEEPQHSHTQLMEKLIQRYQNDTPEKGSFIGFTVKKGKGADGLPNRCIFVSQRANPYAFKKPGTDEQGKNQPSEIWQQAIKRTFDSLWKAEKDLSAETLAQFKSATMEKPDITSLQKSIKANWHKTSSEEGNRSKIEQEMVESWKQAKNRLLGDL